MSNGEEEYLGKMRAYVAETRRLLSNESKPDREQLVCRAFLRAIGVAFEEIEIFAPSTEPVDVTFRDARFQIREILDENRRRGDEYRMKEVRYQEARRIEDVMVPWRSPVRMSFDELTALTAAALEAKVAKYRSGRAELDALAYIDLADPPRFLDPDSPAKESALLEAQGWRSVSILFPPYGIVVTATSTAPQFIRTRLHKTLMECKDPHDLWEPKPSQGSAR